MRTLVLAVAVCITAFFLWQQSEQSKKIDEVKALIAQNSDVMAQPPVPETRAHLQQDGDVALLEEVIASEMLRLDLYGVRFVDAKVRLLRFLLFVKQVESNGKRYAKAKTSSAMSFFQFTKGSVPTAVNRLQNYMSRNHLGPLPDWANELRKEPLSLYEVPELRQATLALVNIAEQRGSDEPLKALLAGEREQAKVIYYTHHHTAPDEATLRRTEKIFARVFH